MSKINLQQPSEFAGKIFIMPDRMPEKMSECMPERMSEYMSNLKKVYIYFQMVCQKLCQNNVSGLGSLEESNVFLWRKNHGADLEELQRKNREARQASMKLGYHIDWGWVERKILYGYLVRIQMPWN